MNTLFFWTQLLPEPLTSLLQPKQFGRREREGEIIWFQRKTFPIPTWQNLEDGGGVHDGIRPIFSPGDRTKMTGSDEIPLLLKSGA